MSVSEETGYVTNVLADVAHAADTTKGAAETVLGSSEAVQAAIEVLQVDVSEFFSRDCGLATIIRYAAPLALRAAQAGLGCRVQKHPQYSTG